jgi:hypothetical protein
MGMTTRPREPHGLGRGRIPPDPEMLRYVAEQVVAGPGAVARIGDVYADFLAWRVQDGPPPSRTLVGRRFRASLEAGIAKGKGGPKQARVNVYLGVALRTPTPSPATPGPATAAIASTSTPSRPD